MATGGREPSVVDVNNVNKELINQGVKPIVNKKAAGSAIGSDVLSQMLGDRTLRKRSVMPVKFNFGTAKYTLQKNTTENAACPSTSTSASFFGKSSGVTLNPPCNERSIYVKKVLPLSSSQPEKTSSDVPLSTNVERSTTAGSGESNTDNLSFPGNDAERQEDLNCPICKIDVVGEGIEGLLCEMCLS